MQQPQTQPPHPQQHTRQRNKLHKSGDPRGHRPTDSGVGIADSEPIQSSIRPDSNWRGPDEAIGGGTYTRDHVQPLESIRSELNAETPPQDGYYRFQKDTNRDNEGIFGSAGAVGAMGPMGATQQPNEPETVERMAQEERISDDNSPYWGDLPKEGGGVHNTVTGHGSASDDHDQHHHLPERSADSNPETSRIVGPIADYPRGRGIYNTVTGHGSKDDEVRRHSRERSANLGADTPVVLDLGPGPVNDFADPLPDIPEETSRAQTEKPDIEPALLPETAVRDDVLLAANAPAATARKPSAQPDPMAPSLQTHEPRAFPLTGPETEARTRTGSEDYHSALAGAAGLGAGVAASRAVDRRRKDSSDLSPAGQEGTQPQSLGQNTTQPAGGMVAVDRQDHTKSSSGRKTRSQSDASAKSDKKHKILGIFHRHKDEEPSSPDHRKKSASDHPETKTDAMVAGSPNRLRKNSKSSGTSTSDRKDSSGPGADDHPDRFSGKEKAAAGAAAGAGAFGLFHRRKNSKDLNAENPERQEGMMPGQQQTQRQVEPSRFDNSQHLSAAAGGAGPADAQPLSQIEEVSTPFEHPREPPMPPQDTHAADRDVVAKEPGDYTVLVSSGAPPVAKQASQSANRDRSAIVAQEPGDYNILTSAGTSPEVRKSSSNLPGDSKAGEVTQKPGDYNILASGVPSGIKRDSPTSGDPADTRHATKPKTGETTGQYNVLPSGTPSGVKVSPKQGRRTSPVTHADRQDGHGQYNTLASRAAFGLNPSSAQAQTQRSLKSHAGPTAVIAADTSANDRADALKELPLPSQTTTSSSNLTMQQPQYQSQQHQNTILAAPVPLHPTNSQKGLNPATSLQQQLPNPSQESVPGITTYPHPEMVQNMSPEVMPSAYTESVSRQKIPVSGGNNSVGGAGFGAGSGPQGGRGQGMSPEVMPSAYTASAPQQNAPVGGSNNKSFATASSSSGLWPGSNTKPQGSQGMSPEVMPSAYTTSSAARESDTGIGNGNAIASQGQGQGQGRGGKEAVLAGAKGAWAGSAPALGSGPGQGKVVHRCEHCGRENDISEYFNGMMQKL